MELIQIYGNTWGLKDWQIIPVYRLDAHRAILLDSGLASQRKAIEDVLEQNNIQLCGILGTHTHIDHGANHAYFQNKYKIPVTLPLGEAGLASSHLALKSLFITMAQESCMAYENIRELKVLADAYIFPDETSADLCGVSFQVIHTPGHTLDHVSYVTPDNVLYVGDAVVSAEGLKHMKLAYNLSVGKTLESLELLKAGNWSAVIFAHKGTDRDILPHIENYRDYLIRQAEEIFELVRTPMTAGQIHELAARRYDFHSKDLLKTDIFIRTIQSYREYLTDVKKLRCYAENGIRMYDGCPG